MKVLFWRVLVELPAVEEKSKGGILLPTDVQDAVAATTMIGKVIDMGEFAFKARTSLGYDYASEPNKPKIGDWVVVPKYGSRDLNMADGRKCRLLEDYEILAVTNDPKELKNYV